MKGIDWPLLCVAAASLLGFCVQQNEIKNLSWRVDSLSSTEENIWKMEDSPFTLVDDWWVADPKMFRFPQGVVVGDRVDDCVYGRAVLSVRIVNQRGRGLNCSSGDASVTFGYGNTASGKYSTVLGGSYNIAQGT